MKISDPRVKERENFFVGLSSTSNLEKNKMISDLRNRDKNTKLSLTREIMNNIASDFIQENQENCHFNFGLSVDLLECVKELKLILPNPKENLDDLISLFCEGVKQEECIVNDIFDYDILKFISQNVFDDKNGLSIPLLKVIATLALRQFKVDLLIKLNVHEMLRKVLDIQLNSNITLLILYFFTSSILSSPENAKIIYQINVLLKVLIFAFDIPQDSIQILALKSFLCIIENIPNFPSDQLIEIIDPIMSAFEKYDKIQNTDLRICLLESIEQISLKPEINVLYEKLDFNQIFGILENDYIVEEKVIAITILCNLLENSDYDFSETLIQKKFVQIFVRRFFKEDVVIQCSISKFLISMSLNFSGMAETYKNSCDKLFLYILENSDNSFMLECSCCYLALIADFEISYNYDKVLESLIVRIYRSTEGLYNFLCLLLHYFRSNSVVVIKEYIIYETEKIISCLFNSNQESQIVCLASFIQESLEKRKLN